MDEPQVKVLLVEDDEDDYILTREVFSEIKEKRFQLDWAPSFAEGLELMARNQHDIYLLDYRLGAENGIQLLRAAIQRGCRSPVILLTGQGERQVDLEAMEAGAADYLVKEQLKAGTLERSIRYALERQRAAALAAFEQARLAAFGTEVGLALTRNEQLDAILDRCAGAMAQYLNATLAQIWILDDANQCLELHGVCVTSITTTDPALKFLTPKLDLSLLVQGTPRLIKQLAGNEEMPEQDWVAREHLVSYAAYPLILEGRLVGLMSIFSSGPFTEAIFQELASVANGIALCIERKRAKAALDASEVRYRTVVENIREVIYQMNQYGAWTYLNPAWTEMTGFAVNDTLGTTFLDYIHPDERDQNRRVFLQLVERNQEFYRHETRYLTKDGHFRWVEAYTQLLFDADKAILGVTGTLTDITERKQSEIQIQKLAAFPRFNPNPVLEFSADGTLTYFNNAAQQMAKTLGKVTPLPLLPDDSGEIVMKCYASGQNVLRQETNVGGRTLSWSFFPIVASNVVHCYGADITELLSLESQFRHAQKLESVGQLAAGIAHDFNNTLTIIQGNANLILERNHLDESASNQLKQITSAAQRATALTRQLLMFSRKQVIQTQPLDLNVLLCSLARVLPRLLGEDIALEAGDESEISCIEADAGMIEQVVINLAVNARDAMPKGGKLSLGASMHTIAETDVRTHPDARAGHFVCLTVADSGCGMDQETLNRIFEPFFTTKEVGKGTGLGLATAYGIVKQHQGWIEVESRVNAGTIFRIFFPAASEPASLPHKEASQPPVTCRGRNETILLVEDEPDLRRMVRDTLEGYDYRVLEAANGLEALQVWGDHTGRIDLLLTDIVMPEGLNGFELAEKIKNRKPDIKVIYTSGYSPETSATGFMRPNDVFLPKPYSLQQLNRILRERLDKETVLG